MNSRTTNPFVGPRSFGIQQRDVFFGRGRQTADLLSLISATQVLLLHAPSGAGKTSLINAGLRPALEEQGVEVLSGRVSGPFSGDPSDDKTNIFVLNLLSHFEQKPRATQFGRPRASKRGAEGQVSASQSDPLTESVEVIGRLRTTRLKDYLSERETLLDEVGEPALRVIFIDQFEEFFTVHLEHWMRRTDFFDQIQEALKDNEQLRVVIAMREDYLGQMDIFASRLPGGLRNRYRLDLLREKSALQAIKSPMETTDRRFAHLVAERLVTQLLELRFDTGTGKPITITGEFVEPVILQVVCQKLWDELPEGSDLITHELLDRYVNVDKALSGFYDYAVLKASEKSQVDEHALRVWVQDTFITSIGTRNHIYRAQGKTAGMPNEVLDELEFNGLLRAELRSGARWYELTHDRLIEPIRLSNLRHLRIDRADQGSDASFQGYEFLANAEEARLAGRLDEAVTAAENALQIYSESNDIPGQTDAWTSIGRVRHEQSDYEAALAAYTSALELNPDLADAWNGIGSISHTRGDTEEAINAYERSLECRPGDSQALTGLGDALFSERRFDEAVEAFEQVLSIESDAYVANRIGNARFEQGRMEEAAKAFRRATEIDATLWFPHYNLGLALQQLRQLPDAARAYKRATQLNKDDPTLYNALGIAYYFMNRYENARRAFRRALEMDSKETIYWSNYGLVSTLLDDFGEAKAALDKALELGPDHAGTTTNMGNMYLRQGDLEQAAEWYQRSCESSPEEDVEPLVRLAAVRQAQGDEEQAVALSRRALRLLTSMQGAGDYDPVDLLELRSLALLLKGDRTEALDAAALASKEAGKHEFESARLGIYELLRSSPRPPPVLDRYLSALGYSLSPVSTDKLKGSEEEVSVAADLP